MQTSQQEKLRRYPDRVCGRLIAVSLACLPLLACEPSTSQERDPVPGGPARIELNQRVYDEVLDLVERNIFDATLLDSRWDDAKVRHAVPAGNATDESALYAEINRLLAELDVSHLQASTPDQARERQSGQTAAVGLRGQEVEGTMVVVDVIPDSPADRAGVRRGWVVTSLNGVRLPIEDETFRLAPDQPIRYEFLDPGNQRHAITLNPGVLSPQRREVRVLDDNLVYIRFDQFDLGSTRWLSRELDRHEGSAGVVLDLRFNSGGSGLAMKLALGEFYEGRFRDSIENAGVWLDRESEVEEFSALSLFSAGYTGDLVILVDGASRSAAEVFARVLQYHERATVVGRTTAGAVIAAERYELPDGGSLLVPIRDYRDPGGERLEGRGVAPDLRVEPELAEVRERDPDLARAVELLLSSSGAGP